MATKDVTLTNMSPQLIRSNLPNGILVLTGLEIG